MGYDYVIGGDLALDDVVFLDGTVSPGLQIGGAGSYAYTGIKLWTDSVVQVSSVGKDYWELFGPWAKTNQISTEGIQVRCERCARTTMRFQDKTGIMLPQPVPRTAEELMAKFTSWKNYGYMKMRPEDLEPFTKGKGVKGVYMVSNMDRVTWAKMAELSRRDGFKVMWEIELVGLYPDKLRNVSEICAEAVDLFSINIAEAQNLFDCEGDEACIRGLQQLDVDMTLFRVGHRGAYVVTKEDVIYLPPAPGPVVDPTGCGNSSTAAALYAYCQGEDPLMVGIMANVTSSINIRQYGVIPDMLAVRNEAYELAQSLYAQYRKV